MFQRLLVPVDRSPESEEALDSAVAIALASRASLEIVVVRERTLATELPRLRRAGCRVFSRRRAVNSWSAGRCV